MIYYSETINKEEEEQSINDIYNNLIDIKNFNFSTIKEIIYKTKTYTNININKEFLLHVDEHIKIRNAFPIYIDTENKLIDDYNYVHKVVKYILSIKS